MSNRERVCSLPAAFPPSTISHPTPHLRSSYSCVGMGMDMNGGMNVGVEVGMNVGMRVDMEVWACPCV